MERRSRQPCRPRGTRAARRPGHRHAAKLATLALELVEQAIKAHGGAELYASASSIRVRVQCTGWAFVMRLKRGALADFTGTVSTAEPRTVLEPYPKAGQRGVFDRKAVRIETDDGEVLSERENPRAVIRSFRRNFWWDDLDLLYFAGYALWNYMSAPFMFTRPGFELEERAAWEEDGERWRGLHVVFPDDIPTHSREQDFYFDETGLLRRLDYTAEVFGAWAKAAHYCWDHERFSGLVVPTRRKAVPRRRSGKPSMGVSVVSLRFREVELVPR